VALPIGGIITRGSGDISSNKNQTIITQNTNRLDINWQDFSIVSNETVIFNQPDSDSLAINRVVGGIPSQIDGVLNANGRIFVINDSGITFGGGAKINVGSLLATTHDVVEQPDGTFFTEMGGYAQIVNNGNISVSDGGFAILAAPYVENDGFIKADLGEIHLASGTKSTLDLRGDGKFLFILQDGSDIEVPEQKSVGVYQKGIVQARSGLVHIAAKKVNGVVSSVINLDGFIDATSFTPNGDGGNVLITSQGHIDLKDNAVLDASANDNGNGGSVEVIATKIAVAREQGTMRSRGGSVSGDGGFMEFSGYDKLFVLGGNYDATAINGKRGTILFDPTDVIINGVGGGIGLLTLIDEFADVATGAILDTLLELSAADVVVQATNDITVNTELSFANGLNAFDQLTLQAGDDIIIRFC
tara:strand:- start:35 stop:1285 length:1251 start_codon:yes stop_codon:yes gene_type:complete